MALQPFSIDHWLTHEPSYALTGYVLRVLSRARTRNPSTRNAQPLMSLSPEIPVHRLGAVLYLRDSITRCAFCRAPKRVTRQHVTRNLL